MLIESNTTYNNGQTSPAITRNHLTFPERVTLLESMKTVISMKDGKCVYAPGWSDERVAKQFVGGRATLLNVIHLRKECFGKLIECQKVRKATTAARISKLELRIERLEHDISKMFLRK